MKYLSFSLWEDNPIYTMEVIKRQFDFYDKNP